MSQEWDSWKQQYPFLDDANDSDEDDINGNPGRSDPNRDSNRNDPNKPSTAPGSTTPPRNPK